MICGVLIISLWFLSAMMLRWFLSRHTARLFCWQMRAEDLPYILALHAESIQNVVFDLDVCRTFLIFNTLSLNCGVQSIFRQTRCFQCHSYFFIPHKTSLIMLIWLIKMHCENQSWNKIILNFVVNFQENLSGSSIFGFNYSFFPYISQRTITSSRTFFWQPVYFDESKKTDKQGIRP